MHGIDDVLYGYGEDADEGDADSGNVVVDIIVVLIYFCAIFGPTVLGGCLFCYAYKDSERKRKAHEEKKR